MEFFQEPLVMLFGQRNPGFDSVIVSPYRGNASKVHVTFTEARYSVEESCTVESLDHYTRKYAIVEETVRRLQSGLAAKAKPNKKDKMRTEEWQSQTKEDEQEEDQAYIVAV